jgi:hypothetical protein
MERDNLVARLGIYFLSENLNGVIIESTGSSTSIREDRWLRAELTEYSEKKVEAQGNAIGRARAFGGAKLVYMDGRREGLPVPHGVVM